jgi:hypothetical protein
VDRDICLARRDGIWKSLEFDSPGFMASSKDVGGMTGTLE